MQALVNSSSNIAEMNQKLEEFASSKALSMSSSDIASKMVTMLLVEKQQNWKKAARMSSKGGPIYKALYRTVRQDFKVEYKTIIDDNALLIKTLPYSIAKSVSLKAAKLATEGKRASEIAKIIKLEFPQDSKAKANLIARTEVSKASTAVTQVQSQAIGAKWYIWRTSEDVRVRSSHNHMEGVLVRWNDAPAPELLNKQPSSGYYHAGNIYNCRCYAEPVIDTGLVKWPAKVYYNGQIQMMTKVKFEALNPAKVTKKTQPDPIAISAKEQAKADKDYDDFIKEALEKDKQDKIKKMEKELQEEQKKQKIKEQKEALAELNQKSSGIDMNFKYDINEFKEIGHWDAYELAKKHTEHIAKKRGAKMAIKDYSGTAYSPMNNHLRGRGKYTDDATKDRIKKVMKAYEGAPPVAENDALLYRAIGYSFIKNALPNEKNFADEVETRFSRLDNRYGGVIRALRAGNEPDPDELMHYERDKDELEKALKAKLTGVVAMEQAFTSTAYTRFAFGSSREIQLKILAPKDKAEAMVITGVSNYGTGEAEVLFNAGMTYRIDDVQLEVTSAGLKISPTVVVIGHDEEHKAKFK